MKIALDAKLGARYLPILLMEHEVVTESTWAEPDASWVRRAERNGAEIIFSVDRHLPMTYIPVVWTPRAVGRRHLLNWILDVLVELRHISYDTWEQAIERLNFWTQADDLYKLPKTNRVYKRLKRLHLQPHARQIMDCPPSARMVERVS